MKNLNIPKLRFKGFEEGWKENKLGQISKFWNGKAHEQDVADNGKYIIVNSKFVSTNGKIKKFSNSQISPLGKNDIAIVMSDIPNGKAIGKCFLVDKNDKYTLNQRIGGISSSKAISNFLIRVISRNKYFLKFDNGVSQTNLRKEEILNCPVKYPEIEEQQKISQFIDNIDQWIGNLKGQKENLEKYKKGMMQKIFEQNIRFKDKNGKEFPKWEEKRLENILSSIVDNRGKTPPISLNGFPLIEINAIGRKEIDYSKITKYVTNKTYESWFRNYLKNNDLLISTVGNTALLSMYKDNTISVVAQNVVGLHFEKENPNFMFYLLSEKKNNHKFKRIEMVAVQPSIKVSQMIKIKFDLPGIDEQQKIADFLTSIDTLIDSKQEQIAKAEEWKKGLMQRLFV